MNKLIKYINIPIAALLIFFLFFFNSFEKISTQLDAILPNSEEKELLEQFNQFQATKKLFLLVLGTNKESLQKIKDIEAKISKIENIEIENINNKKLKEYQTKYNLYLNELDTNKLKNIDIKNELEYIKDKLLNSDFIYRVDNYDPFNLLKKDNKISNIVLKNNHLSLKNEAYISIFNLNVNSLSQYERVYNSVYKIVENANNDIKIFSPIFYFVENSKIIKNDVNKIIVLSSLVLIILYILILRNIKLLLNTLLSIANSILLSLFICTLLFENISVFTIVFGISISTVAIDYMFHNYIHKYYNHDKNKFNKEVFLGMITTVGTFLIISLISFPLIKQISIFAAISLLFSYIQFTYLFKKMGFSYMNEVNLKEKTFVKIDPKVIIFFSFILIIISIINFRFDTNLKNLDVTNEKLESLEKYFNEKLLTKAQIPVLIKSDSLNDLIEKSKLLKLKFPNSNVPLGNLISEKEFLLKKEFLKDNLDIFKKELTKEAINLNFKKDFFNKSYTYSHEKPLYSIEYIKTLGIEVIKYNNMYLSYANLPKDKKDIFSKYEFIKVLSIKDMFEKNLKDIYKQLIFYGLIALIFILAMSYFSNKNNYLITLCFILFPLSLVLCLSFLFDFNILHIFMIFILLSISIDYGIFVASRNYTINTNKAIIYSLLSTFAGFGVLIFSNINSLFSIGIIATIGIVAISILLFSINRTN